MTDEQLLTLASRRHHAAADAVVALFRNLAFSIANDYYLPGSDRDDLHQEALIGIWNAVRAWRADRGSSAKTFIGLCVRRHLISCVKSSRRSRHEILTWSNRTTVNEDGDTDEAVVFVEQFGGDPADIIVLREQLRELADDLRVQLSPLEARCLLLWANGLNYAEINTIVDLSWKGVDRAITRARWKLRDTGPPSSLGQSKRLASPLLAACSSCGRPRRRTSRRNPMPPVCSVCSLRELEEAP